ncbi:MAG TPA: hypothetical protein VF704_08445, partial [Allosphingosinicella sp.]
MQALYRSYAGTTPRHHGQIVYFRRNQLAMRFREFAPGARWGSGTTSDILRGIFQSQSQYIR